MVPVTNRFDSDVSDGDGSAVVAEPSTVPSALLVVILVCCCCACVGYSLGNGLGWKLSIVGTLFINNTKMSTTQRGHPRRTDGAFLCCVPHNIVVSLWVLDCLSCPCRPCCLCSKTNQNESCRMVVGGDAASFVLRPKKLRQPQSGLFLDWTGDCNVRQLLHTCSLVQRNVALAVQQQSLLTVSVPTFEKGESHRCLPAYVMCACVYLYLLLQQ